MAYPFTVTNFYIHVLLTDPCYCFAPLANQKLDFDMQFYNTMVTANHSPAVCLHFEITADD